MHLFCVKKKGISFGFLFLFYFSSLFSSWGSFYLLTCSKDVLNMNISGFMFPFDFLAYNYLFSGSVKMTRNCFTLRMQDAWGSFYLRTCSKCVLNMPAVWSSVPLFTFLCNSVLGEVFIYPHVLNAFLIFLSSGLLSYFDIVADDQLFSGSVTMRKNCFTLPMQDARGSFYLPTWSNF
eukprot:TRINITY_DN11203_c0_g1_i1.p1 TRINITY_DN11203_c0_g1~~TRINITY_DN11203_c0_g1_i1.p1  ORF type:complete len:178 (-),score=12.66 TRINITY_DN11203_c0_g1_i1:401-934(-)